MMMMMMMMLVVLIELMLIGLAASSSLTNVALNNPAAMSTAYWDHPELTAEKAVDGNPSTYYKDCIHTNGTGPHHWWIVDLKGSFQIFSVQITNRGDCCGYKFRDFDIQVFMLNPMNIIAAKAHLCYHHDGPMEEGVTELFQCSQPITGRYVRVYMERNDFQPLHICEVEVMARNPDSTSRMYFATKGQKATGDLIREVTSRRVMQCLVWCSSDVSCSAVNMGPKTWTSAGWSTVCQLLSFGGIGQPDSTTPNPDWNFYSIGDL